MRSVWFPAACAVTNSADLSQLSGSKEESSVLMRGLGCVFCPPSASGGLPGWSRRGAAGWTGKGSWVLWGGVCYEHTEKGAVGRTWILGRRMSF